MKKLTAKSLTGLVLVSGIVAASTYAVVANVNKKYIDDEILNIAEKGASARTLVSNSQKETTSVVDNEVQKVAAKVETATKEVKEATAKVESATKEVKEAETLQKEAAKEVTQAEKAVQKANNAVKAAQAEVKAAKTEEAKKAAQAKVEKAQADAKKAEEAKKEADLKVEQAELAKKEAEAKKEAALEAEKKANEAKQALEAEQKRLEEENQRKLAEANKAKEAEAQNKIAETQKVEKKAQKKSATTKQSTQSATNAETNSNRSLTDEQWKKIQEALKRDAETRAQEEALKAEEEAKAKAEREAEAAQKALEEERKRQEREAWEADIQKQSAVVNGYDTYDREFTFKSAPSNAEEEKYIQSLDRVKSNISSNVVYTNGSITVDKTSNLANGQIWWVEMSCDLNMCEGFTGHFNTAKVSVRLEGLRDSVDSYTLTAPKAKAGYQFVGWKTYDVTYTNNGDKVVIRGYEAVYAPFSK